MPGRATLFSVALLSLAFAPAPLPKHRKAEGELDKLQGTWVLTRQECAGVPDKNLRITIVIRGTRFRYLDARGATISEWSLALDTESNPKRLDMADLGRPTSSQWGVYRFEGEVLKTCCTWQMGARPADFDSRKPLRIFSVYRRIKR